MNPGLCPDCSHPQLVAADQVGQVSPCPGCKAPLKSFLVGGEDSVEIRLMRVVAASGAAVPEFLESEDFRKKYRPFKKLGEGGMGIVHKAIEVATNRRVAIKSLTFHGSPELTQRFVQEGQILAKLDHPNIVKLVEVGHESDHYYMVFEMVDGVTLQEELQRDLAMPPKRALETISQVLKGLEHAHSLGVIHRDMKPENILLTKFGYAKIADFGLAKTYGVTLDSEEPPDAPAPPAPEELASSDSRSTLVVSGIHQVPSDLLGARKTRGGRTRTGHGAVMGTPSYMSPEQAQGKPVNHQTDIYAVGIMLWELLAGRQLYKGNDIEEILRRQIHEKPPPPSKVNQTIPAFLDEIVEKATAKSHLDRYQSARDFNMAVAKAIRRLDEGSATRPPAPPSATVRAAARTTSMSGVRSAMQPVKPAPAARSPTLWLAIVALVLVAVAIAIFLTRA